MKYIFDGLSPKYIQLVFTRCDLEENQIWTRNFYKDYKDNLQKIIYNSKKEDLKK